MPKPFSATIQSIRPSNQDDCWEIFIRGRLASGGAWLTAHKLELGCEPFEGMEIQVMPPYVCSTPVDESVPMMPSELFYKQREHLELKTLCQSMLQVHRRREHQGGSEMDLYLQKMATILESQP